MALGLSMNGRWSFFAVASLMACATTTSRDVKVASSEAIPDPRPETPEPTAASPSPAVWPDRSELFIAMTSERILELRAFGVAGLEPFTYVIANDIQQTLYNPELQLFWFHETDRLWVIDLRTVGSGVVKPELIASHLPRIDKLYISRGGRTFQAPGQVGDESSEFWLHWDEHPYLEGGDSEARIDGLDGAAWLSRERARPARAAPAWAEFAHDAPHAPLPAARAQCTDKRQCGAALPFGNRGWQLVISGDEYGDFEHHFCLLYDPAKQVFATPPEAKTWADATTLESAGCGPYFFNERNDAYFASDVICHTAGDCAALDDAGAEGWIMPGVGVGAL
jgi:hypothetical protein